MRTRVSPVLSAAFFCGLRDIEVRSDQPIWSIMTRRIRAHTASLPITSHQGKKHASCYFGCSSFTG